MIPQSGPSSTGGTVDARKVNSVDERYSLVYEELRRIASSLLLADINATISPTSLVDEAWIKLRRSDKLALTSTGHFKAIAASAMRQVLVEEARRRTAAKRGAANTVSLVSLQIEPSSSASVEVEILDLEEALTELSVRNPLHSEIVEKLFYGGMTISETAETLSISESKVERDWRACRAWLATRIRPSQQRWPV